ncbi:MAG: hypothetical protein ACO3Z6_05000 [Pseudomonadales bacterium]|jgi:hypothetical protein
MTTTITDARVTTMTAIIVRVIVVMNCGITGITHGAVMSGAIGTANGIGTTLVAITDTVTMGVMTIATGITGATATTSVSASAMMIEPSYQRSNTSWIAVS